MNERRQERTPVPIKTDQRRAQVIINPMAFGGTGCDAILAEAERVLQASGYHIEIVPTTEEDHGRGLAQQAARDGVDLVVAAGGDGTIHEVVTGLIQSKTTLGIIPLGTMNNIARGLNIPADPLEACAILGTGTPQPIDIGLLNNRPFLEFVSIGMEAPLFPLAEQLRHKGVLGALQAFFGGIRLLLQSKNQIVSVEIDGKRRRHLARQITIGNAPYFGLGFQIDERASMSDGRLDVLMARYGHRRDLFVHYWSIATGGRMQRTHTRVHRAKRIRIEPVTPMPVAIDGEAAGQTPVTVSIHPAAVMVLAPPQSTIPAAVPAQDIPLQRVLRSLSPRGEATDLHYFYPGETIVARWRIAALTSWLLTALTTIFGWFAIQQRWWPVAPRHEKPLPAPKTPSRDLLLWRGAIAALGAIFVRLRLPYEAFVALSASGLRLVEWALSPIWRRNPHLPPADERTMTAVVTTGMLAAGLWTSRRATWRRNVFLLGLGALAAWFSGSHPLPESPRHRQRQSQMLGAILGLTWLSALISSTAAVQRVLLRIAHRPSHLERHTSTQVTRSNAPPPANARYTQTIVPVAMLQPLERGDIVLFGPDGTFGAKMIELATQSHYHHVAIYDGEGMVIEAMPHGVRRYLIGERNVTAIRPKVSEGQRRAAAEWVRDQIGKPYDTPGLALIAFDRAFPGLRLGSSNASRFSCAVFIADAYMHAGVDLLPGQRWQDLVPGDYVQLLDMPPKE